MAISAQTKVLTLDYWKTASQLKVGDWVFDRNGELVQIKLVQQYRSETCYKVLFTDNLTVSGDNHLAFPLENKTYRDHTFQYKGVQRFRRPIGYYSVSTLLSTPLQNKYYSHLYSVPTTKPLELPYQDLPVHPFVFGFWFFNRKAHNRIMPPSEYLDVVIQKIKDCGYAVTKHNQGDKHRANIQLKPSVSAQLIGNIPTKLPNNYLLAAPEQRLDLLRGILYAQSRRYSAKTNKFRITHASQTIILQIQMLLESLGHRITIMYCDIYKTYTVLFKSRLDLMHHQTKLPIKVHMARRHVHKITEIPAQLCVYLETTTEDSTILVGEGFIACR